LEYREMQQSTMRKSRPFQWIEEAEARQVVTLALSEALDPPRPSAPAWRMWLRFRGSASPEAAIATNDAVSTAVMNPLPR
jgi:hypothetical protein